MSRFGSTATFVYQAGDAITAGTTVVLTPSHMPQYPFETSYITDRQSYRTKSGRSWQYENYNVPAYTFVFSMIDEAMLGTLKTMFNAKPILTFNSNGTLWGTFRMAPESWRDSEIAFELYDCEFVLETVA